MDRSQVPLAGPVMPGMGPPRDLRKAALTSAAAAAPMGPPPAPAASLVPPQAPVRGLKKEFTPVEWSAYFDRKETIHLRAPPLTRALHSFNAYFAGTAGPVFVLLHGAGHSGLSWAVCASHLKQRCRVMAYDFRGHGETETADAGNLAADVLVQDTVDVVKAVYGEEQPPIVLVGHSMGGAIAARAAVAVEGIPSLAGLAVIDVVEGTALQSLQHMRGVLQQRPPGFESLPRAIEWSVKSGTLRSVASARVSFPGQLKALGNGKYGWRIDLFESERYWHGWFAGLSELFLSARVPKMLLVAGTDRLDRPLTIAQMQGKFQLALIYGTGHSVHEDEPEKTAGQLLEFVERNRVGMGPLVPVPGHPPISPAVPRPPVPLAGPLAGPAAAPRPPRPAPGASADCPGAVPLPHFGGETVEEGDEEVDAP
eukprot:tig00021582_g22640.t1